MISITGKINPVMTLVRLLLSVFGAALIALSLGLGVQAAEQSKSEAKPPKVEAEPSGLAAKQVPLTDAQQYCVNITGAAVDARYAWQNKKLAELEDQIKSRIAELEAKQAEYKDWISRREALAKQAQENLVGVYAHMRPEIAAAQLGALDDDMAAAILAQLNARVASSILNEFQPEHAARLANVMAGRPVPPADGKKL